MSCKKSINALKCLKGIHKGGNRETLLTVFQSMIVSKISYGSQFYETAPKTSLKLLDPILNEAVRIATGAFKTSPIKSLIAEAGILPLSHRRELQKIKYFITERSNRNPLMSHNRELTNNFYNRAMSTCSHYNISTDVYRFPAKRQRFFHEFNKIKTNTVLSKYNKDSTTPVLYKKEFLKIKHEFVGTIFYTDASKQNGLTGFAVVRENEIMAKIRTPNNCSIFTVEAAAVLKAINVIENSQDYNSMICTDSASVVAAVKNPRTKCPIINAIQQALIETTKAITLMWIPGHSSIEGNEKADQTAKAATETDYVELIINTPVDLKNFATKRIWNEFNSEWQTNTSHLNQIKTNCNKWSSSNLTNRRDSTVICRIRIGHTNVTHIHRIMKTSIPVCTKCNQAPLTVPHILVDCPAVAGSRAKYNLPISLRDMLGDNEAELYKVIEFLKDIGMYKDI